MAERSSPERMTPEPTRFGRRRLSRRIGETPPRDPGHVGMHSFSFASQPLPVHPNAPPPTTSPLKRAVLRMAITAGAVIGLPIVIAGGLWIHGQVTPQHTVLVDNGNDFPVDVTIGGRKVTLDPRSTASVPAWPGEVTAKAKGTGLDEAYTLDMPEVGWAAGGRHAVYNVGGKTQLAIVRMTYGTTTGKDQPPVSAIPRRDRFTLLPVGVTGTIDEAFPKSVKTKSWGASISHVCRVDSATRKVGCGIQ